MARSAWALAVVLALPSLCAGQAWPHIGYDSYRSGKSPYLGPQLTPSGYRFTFSLPDAGSASPPTIGSSGSVYTCSSNSHCYAFSGTTGALQWTYTAGGAVYSSPTIDTAGNRA